MTADFIRESRRLTDPAAAGNLANAFHGTARLTNLLKRFASIEPGARLLDLAERHGLAISYSGQLPPDRAGEFGPKGIAINRTFDDDENLATLAHELHHFQQECDGLSMLRRREGARIDAFPLRDPETYFHLVRLREADAMAFEAVYIRAYTDATGDTKPAEKMMRRHPEIYGACRQAMADSGGDKTAAHQAAFNAFFGGTSDRYDRQTLEMLGIVLEEQKSLRAQDTDGARGLLSRTSPLVLDDKTVRKLGGVTAETAAWRKTDPGTKDALEELKRKYAAFFKPSVPANRPGPRP